MILLLTGGRGEVDYAVTIELHTCMSEKFNGSGSTRNGKTKETELVQDLYI